MFPDWPEKSWKYWLLHNAPTWLVALATVGTLIATSHYMGKQVDEMQKATNLQMRPFLHVEIPTNDTTHPLIYGMFVQIGDEKDNDFRSIDSVRIGSDAYKARKGAQVLLDFPIKVDNYGKTPLWLKSMFSSTLLYDEWVDKYHKNPSELIEFVKRLPEYRPYETDICLFPNNSNFTTREFKQRSIVNSRNLSKELFDKVLDDSSSLIVYPYVYAEYQDFYGEQYNAILVVVSHIDIQVKDGFGRIGGLSGAIEAYRYDLQVFNNTSKQ